MKITSRSRSGENWKAICVLFCIIKTFIKAKNMKTLMAILSGMAAGYLAARFIIPIFLQKSQTENNSGLHNFQLSELISPNSANLEEIKDKIENAS
jgi:xanthine/uracil permease